MTSADFASRVIDWHLQQGRHDLPWQQTSKVKPNPYEVWVSEVMLQQTQVATVIDYFNQFMASFPTVEALATASWDAVAAHWAGLGYYARARNLHASAKVVAESGLPMSTEGWQALKGIGRSTAGAIRAMGQHQYGVIMDGNVKRVLTRFYAIREDVTKASTLKHLWQVAEALTPKTNSGVYAQAVMDLGATLCTRKNPSCSSCPLAVDCKANALGKQTEFPYKPKAKTKPTKQGRVCIFQFTDSKTNQTQWLWLKRPSNGLWGGLWCLPIFEELPATLQSALPDPVTYASIKHTFTHFHWVLEPKVYKLNQKQKDELDTWLGGLNLTVSNEPDKLGDTSPTELAWLGFNEAARKGKPKAIDKVIGKIGIESFS